jgi:hypothetical protein
MSVVRHMVRIEMRPYESDALVTSAFALLFSGVACTDTIALPKPVTIVVSSVADQQGFTGDFALRDPEVLVLDNNGQRMFAARTS